MSDSHFDEESEKMKSVCEKMRRDLSLLEHRNFSDPQQRTLLLESIQRDLLKFKKITEALVDEYR